MLGSFIAAAAAAVSAAAPTPTVDLAGPGTRVESPEIFRKTIIGQRIEPIAVATPEITTAVTVVDPGQSSPLMIHTVPVYIYVLSGSLTVEHADGSHQLFEVGQGHVCSINEWHRARNMGNVPLRFLGVAFAGDGLPPLVRPPVK